MKLKLHIWRQKNAKSEGRMVQQVQHRRCGHVEAPVSAAAAYADTVTDLVQRCPGFVAACEAAAPPWDGGQARVGFQRLKSLGPALSGTAVSVDHADLAAGLRAAFLVGAALALCGLITAATMIAGGPSRRRVTS